MAQISIAEVSTNPSSCALSGLKPLLRTRDLLAVLPFGKSKLYAEIASGRFVAPVKVSRRMSLWRREDVETYLDRLVSEAGCGRC